MDSINSFTQNIHTGSNLYSQKTGPARNSESQFASSKDAVEISGEALKDNNKLFKSADDRFSTQWNTFQNIRNSMNATRQEKSIASLGIEFSRTSLNRKDIVKANTVILKAIHRGISGPMGQVIAQIALNASSGLKPETAQAMMKESMRAIRYDSETTEAQKSMAGLGMEMTDTKLDLYEKDILKAESTILKGIMQENNGSAGQIMAQTALNVEEKLQDAETTQFLMKKALESIQSNGDTTGVEKSLAKMGIDMGDNTEPAPGYREKMKKIKFNIGCEAYKQIRFPFHMSVDEEIFARTYVLNTIANGVTGPAGPVLARTALEITNSLPRIESKDKMQTDAFRAIIDSPETSDFEKEMARRSLKILPDVKPTSWLPEDVYPEYTEHIKRRNHELTNLANR